MAPCVSMPSGQVFFTFYLCASLCVFFFFFPIRNFFKCLGYVVPRTSCTFTVFFPSLIWVSVFWDKLRNSSVSISLCLRAERERRGRAKETHWPLESVSEIYVTSLSLSPPLPFFPSFFLPLLYRPLLLFFFSVTELFPCLAPLYRSLSGSTLRPRGQNYNTGRDGRAARKERPPQS